LVGYGEKKKNWVAFIAEVKEQSDFNGGGSAVEALMVNTVD